MNSAVKYSIIIPHYNIPDLLGRCLRSIPAREDLQVIVVDDNSDGNESYLSIVPELNNRNVEFYVTYDGLGAGHARNVGLSHAKGEWIVFADADDFFSDEMPMILDEFADDSNDIIYFNIQKCDCYNTSNILENSVDILFKNYEETGDERYFRLCFLEPWGKMYKHKFLEDNNIVFQEVKANNDLLFSVRSGVLARKVGIVNRVFYWYVIREGSLFHQKSESVDKISDRVRAWNSAQLFLQMKGVTTNFYLPALPCVPIFKSDWGKLYKIFKFMKRENIRYDLVVRDLMWHYIHKLMTGKNVISVVNIFRGSVL